MWLAGVLLRLGDARGIENVDDARGPGESVGPGERLHLQPRDLQIDSPVHRLLFDRNQARHIPGHRRKRTRQLPVEIRLVSPNSRVSRSRVATRLLPSRHQLGFELGDEHLPSCLLELVDGPRLLSWPARSAEAWRGFDFRESGHDLPGCDRAVIGPARLGGDAQSLLGGAKLRLLGLTPAMRARAGNVASDRMLPTIWRSMSSSIEVEIREMEKLGTGGRLACTNTASAIPRSL